MARAAITQTGPDSAVVGPIVLRHGDLTRMVFKPQIVNNEQDENGPSKATFFGRNVDSPKSGKNRSMKQRVLGAVDSPEEVAVLSMQPWTLRQQQHRSHADCDT